jgi:hypothetical protein
LDTVGPRLDRGAIGAVARAGAVRDTARGRRADHAETQLTKEIAMLCVVPGCATRATTVKDGKEYCDEHSPANLAPPGERCYLCPEPSTRIMYGKPCCGKHKAAG